MPLSWEPRKKDDEVERQAIKILENEGFKDVLKSEVYNAPYDFRAFKNSELFFIEVRGRSPTAKTQFFTFRNTKIKHLYELQKVAKVLILLINKFGHKLITLDELVTNRPKDVLFFEYKRREAKRPTGAWYFSSKGWRVKIPSKKEALIRIRCSEEETKRKFMGFVASKGFRNSEEALKFLLNQSEEKAGREVSIDVSKP